MIDVILKRTIGLCLLLCSLSCWAVIDGHKYPFEDPEDARRFAQLAEELRCPKCQNQNLADSDAPVAADLRDKVYSLLQEGKSDTEVVDYLVARYGDFVRYNPPFRIDTLLLWLSPILLLGVGFLFIRGLVRGQRTNQVVAPSSGDSGLSAAEQQRLDALLGAPESDSNPSKLHKDPNQQ